MGEHTYYPGVDQPHSLTRGGQTYYYTTDHPGKVTGLPNPDGTSVNWYKFTPWGQRTAGSEGVSNALQYAARHYEPQGEIYHMRARWYDP